MDSLEKVLSALKPVIGMSRTSLELLSNLGKPLASFFNTYEL
jgi:hypothetical protein